MSLNVKNNVNNTKKNLMSKGRLRIRPLSNGVSGDDASETSISVADEVDTTNNSIESYPEHTETLSDEYREKPIETKPETIELVSEIQVSPKAAPHNDYHVIMTETLKTWMEESIKLLVNSDIKPQKIEEFINLSKNRPDILTVLARLGTEGVTTICEMDKDDDFIRTGKLKLLSWINNLSKNDTFRSMVQKLGLAVKALRQLKKMSME
jgi:hypothetical protein